MSLGAGFSGGPSRKGDKGLNYSLVQTLKMAWADDELRARLRFLLLVFGLYVLGVHVPVPIPGISTQALEKLLEGNQFFNLMNTVGGGAFKRISIMALGLGPYIIASIIIQVMSLGNPKWKEEMKEGGEYARKQQNKRTRILTLALCAFQGFGLLQLMGPSVTGALQLQHRVGLVLFWTAGAMFLLWLGEQASEKGIGNGVSILIFTGIIISFPGLAMQVGTAVRDGVVQWWQVLLVLIMFYATTWGIVFFTVAQRRIPIQHMRRNFGTQSMGGGTSYLPISVNMAGVIPIIFAITLIYMPAQFQAAFPPDSQAHAILQSISGFFSPDFTRWQGWIGALFYAGMIFMFTYLWTAMQYNVEDIADNLKRGGSYIQGIRPGKKTKDFLDSVISRVTFIGAVFLALAAMTQFVMPLIAPISSLGLIGGTSLLILVSVALETMRQIEANLITKQYEG
ncbi:MAG: preprotein translocase subunit SecY [Armatimonadetes bacterium]|nr:preprotein translocase subunit SecY [Armatimonadota bacterium]